MKSTKLITILLLVLTLLVVALGTSMYIFMQKNKTGQSQAYAYTNDSTQALRVAFFYSDSIMSNYKMVPVMKKELDSERSRLENSLTRKQKNLENRYTNLVKQVQNNTITADNAQREEESIRKGQQELMSIQQDYANQITMKELDMNIVLLDSVRSAVNEYNKSHGFDYILNFTPNQGDLFIVNDKYDISTDIIEILNKKYKTKSSE